MVNKIFHQLSVDFGKFGRYVTIINKTLSASPTAPVSVLSRLTLRKILVTPNVTSILTLTSANFNVLDFAFSSLYAVF